MTKRSVVHIEIPAAAPKEAGEFYKKMFGWEFSQMTEPVSYAGFQAGNTGGGYPELNDQYKPGDVIIYIESEDLQADLDKITKLGGKALGDIMPVPGFGSLAFFQDPTGNRLALWKSEHPE